MLSHEQRHRFDEIARRIDQDITAMDLDMAPIPPTAAVIPVRLAALGLFVVGATGIPIGLARSDAVVLAVVGILPTVVAILLIALVGTSDTASTPQDDPAAGGSERGVPLHKQFWSWLTTCAENGCGNHPVHLGWCSEHASGYDPAPDDYRGDAVNDLR